MMQVIAPAKINLYLHVTGKRNDGYHLLESLVCFADYGDVITVKPSNSLLFEMNGLYAKGINQTDNLVLKAAQAISDYAGKALDLEIHVQKNLPVGAGLGGGSSDAAAIFKAFIEYWESLYHER